MDKMARELVAEMRPHLSQTLIIENASGAGGNIGTMLVARAAPDGHTVLFNHIGMATSSALYKGNLGFKSDADFEPLGLVAESPLAVVARPGIPVGSAVELVRWIAKQPSVKLANAGVGSASHLCGLLLQSALKIDMTSIPYKGTAPAMTDLMGSHVDLMCDLTANVIPQVVGKRVIPVGVTSATPLKGTLLATVPTLEKFGIADVQLTVWYGMYAPKGTPAKVIKALNIAITKAAQSKAFQKAQSDSGIDLIRDARTTPDGHRVYLKQEIARWTPIIKAAAGYVD